MIEFTCTHCQARLNVSDHKAGHSGHCPKCGRTIQVPLPATTVSAHAPLKPLAPAMQQVDDGEIPLADEPPRARAPEPARQQQSLRPAGGPAITPPHAGEAREAGEGIDDGEIPLADEPSRAGAAEPARQHQPLRPAGGRVIAPEDAEDGTKAEEIPLTEEPGETEKQTPREHGPAPTPGGLIIAPVGDATVVSFQNAKILDALVIETIGQELYALVEQRTCRKIVLDLGHVQFLSSQMLGVLTSLHKKAAGIKGRVVLCSVHNDLQKVFRLVSLDRVLPIVADRQAALAMLTRP